MKLNQKTVGITKFEITKFGYYIIMFNWFSFFLNQGNSDGIESYVSPVCLPWSSTDPGFSLTEGQRLVATGWGKITNDRREVLKVSCQNLL